MNTLNINNRRVSTNFEKIVIIAIVLAATLIGIRSFPIPMWLNSSIVAMDWFLTFFFCWELCLRIYSEEKKSDFFKVGWNVFDAIVITLSLIPVEDSELVIIARVLRVFRVMRLVSHVPDLRRLINSLLNTLPKLSYILLMMLIIFYMYGAIGTTIFSKINDDLWGDILVSMLTLFRVMTFEDWTDVMYETMAVYEWSWLYYISFIFLTAFAFLNMIIGVVVSELEQESMVNQQKEDSKTDPLINDIYLELKSLREDVSSLRKQ